MAWNDIAAWVLLGVAVAPAFACDGVDGSEPDTALVERDATSPDAAPVPDADIASEVTSAGDAAAPDLNQLRNGVRARIAHIVDGDTFDVIVGTSEPRSYTIRMRGLSAPECFKGRMDTAWGVRFACNADDELYGLASYQALYAMLHGKEVVVTCDIDADAWCPTDVYDRYLAYVQFSPDADGDPADPSRALDAATEMTRAGAGFSYTDYGASKRGAICAAEYEARAALRGMWALGSLEVILAGMHPSTAAWYREHHDRRCDAAIAAIPVEP